MIPASKRGVHSLSPSPTGAKNEPGACGGSPSATEPSAVEAQLRKEVDAASDLIVNMHRAVCGTGAGVGGVGITLREEEGAVVVSALAERGAAAACNSSLKVLLGNSVFTGWQTNLEVTCGSTMSNLERRRTWTSQTGENDSTTAELGRL